MRILILSCSGFASFPHHTQAVLDVPQTIASKRAPERAPCKPHPKAHPGHPNWA